MQIEASWDHSYTDDCTPNFSTNMGLPRHRWYEFKEGFGHTLVERAINETSLSMGKEHLTILDPFSGSGTTPLTALQNGCGAIAIEVNPFMSFVGRTKCIEKAHSAKIYISELEWILSQKPVEIESKLEDYSTFCSKDGNTKWLFNRSVLRGFEALYKHILNTAHRDFFLLALYSAVMECSNARKDGKCLRYKKNWDLLAFSSKELREIFHKNCQTIISDLDDSPLNNGERIFYEGDAREKLGLLKNNSVDLVVFSPPYLNSFDYSDVYRPELFLGKYVNDNSELRRIRGKTLRSHVQYKWMTSDKPQSTWAKNIAAQVSDNSDKLWDKGIPQMINAYFCDMEKIFSETYKVSSKGAQIWFVVGTSSYAGIEIPVDLILADIATKQGWSLIGVNALRKLRTSSQCINDDIRKVRLRESLVMCHK